MEEKYIIYVIPTSGEKHYVPESEVDNFKLDYPDAILYSESEEYAAIQDGESIEAIQDSKFKDEIEELSEEPEYDEATLNNNHRNKTRSALEEFTASDTGFDPGQQAVRNYVIAEYFDRQEGVQGGFDPNQKYMWRDGQRNTINRVQTEDGELDPGAVELGYVEYIPEKKSYDRTRLPIELLDMDKDLTGNNMDGVRLLNKGVGKVAPLFNDLYGDFGFTFSGAKNTTSGKIAEDKDDVLYVTAANGEKLELQLSTLDGALDGLFGYDREVNNIANRELKSFLEANATEYTPKTFKTIQEMSERPDAGRFLEYYDEDVLLKQVDVIEDKAAQIDSMAQIVKKDSEALNADYLTLQDRIKNKEFKTQEELDVEINKLKEREQQIITDQTALRGVYNREVEQQYASIQKLAAEKLEIDALRGSKKDHLFDVGVLDFIDDALKFQNKGIMTAIGYMTKAADAAGVPEGSLFNPGVEFVEGMTGANLQDKKIKRKEGESDGEYKQRIISDLTIADKGLLKSTFGTDEYGLTDEYSNRYMETLEGEVLTNITQMLTAAAISGVATGGAGLMTGAGIGGIGSGMTGVTGLRSFLARGLKQSVRSPMTYIFGANKANQTMEEMSAPEFDDIPNWEKLAFSSLLGGAQGILENIGVSGALNSSSLITNTLSRVLRKAPVNTGFKTVNKLFEKEINNSIAKGVLRVAGGSLAEAETEIVQELADVGLKKLYNLAHSKGVLKEENSPELFKNTDLSVGQLLHIGKVAALSGMFFGGLSATGQAYNENAINKLNKKSFALSEYLVNSEDARKIYAAKLRNEIQSGKTTKII